MSNENTSDIEELKEYDDVFDFIVTDNFWSLLALFIGSIVTFFLNLDLTISTIVGPNTAVMTATIIIPIISNVCESI